MGGGEAEGARRHARPKDRVMCVWETRSFPEAE